jgi:hypothetical protein
MRKDQSIFEGVKQTRLVLDGFLCYIPLFYTGGTATIAMYPASLKRLKDKSPDVRIDPAVLMPGVGVVTIIAFEFETSIGPVNELCVAVPLKTPGLPLGLSMFQALLRGYMPSWIWHLPVSTAIANVLGREAWGFPKIFADIPITQDDRGMRTCMLSENGKPILRLQGKAIPGKIEFGISLKNHLWQNGCVQTADHVFRMHKVGISLLPGRTRLELLSDHPIARDLEDVLLTRTSISSAFTPSLEAVLHEPDRLTLTLARTLLEAAEKADAMQPEHKAVLRIKKGTKSGGRKL